MLILPVWVSSDERTGYLLVRYDEQDRVEEARHSVSHDWAMTLTAPSGDNANAQINSDDLEVIVSEQGNESLVVAYAATRNGWLRRTLPSDACRVLVGCLGYRCPLKIRFDQRSEDELPYRLDAALLLPAILTPGPHKVRVRSAKGP